MGTGMNNDYFAVFTVQEIFFFETIFQLDHLYLFSLIYFYDEQDIYYIKLVQVDLMFLFNVYLYLNT